MSVANIRKTKSKHKHEEVELKMAAELQDWRKNILQQLEARKTVEIRPFQELIESRRCILLYL